MGNLNGFIGRHVVITLLYNPLWSKFFYSNYMVIYTRRFAILLLTFNLKFGLDLGYFLTPFIIIKLSDYIKLNTCQVTQPETV